MSESKLPESFLEKARAIKAKRPRTVIQHIIEHGQITTEELKDKYGYDHPPRAARDVREEGIPLETFRVANKDGRKIGAYRFGDPSKIQQGKLGGRCVFPKGLKDALLALQGSRCAICLAGYEERYLQVDHRVPYEVAGDADSEERGASHYMLLCGSCNRAKSWSCEHCANWSDAQLEDCCKACYWASPQQYTHVSMAETRRIDIIWVGEEVGAYEELKRRSIETGEELPAFVKHVLHDVATEGE